VAAIAVTQTQTKGNIMARKVKTTPTVNAPEFIGAKALYAAEQSLNKASSRYSEDVAILMQAHVDACTVAAIPKTEDGCKAIARSIMQGMTEVIRKNLPKTAGVSRKDAAEMDASSVWTLSPIPRKTVVEYAASAQRAFFHGVEWSAGLKNDPAYGLPWGKAGKTETTTKAGPVQTTTNEGMFETLYKALAQARMLNRTEFAGALVDVCHEWLAADGFKEPASE
jgi:hypothetical protein